MKKARMTVSQYSILLFLLALLLYQNKNSSVVVHAFSSSTTSAKTTTTTTTTPTVPIVSCSSTTEMQRAISLYLRPADVVLELGAQLSDTSSTICRTIGNQGKAVMIDVKRSDAKSGRSSFRNANPFVKSTTTTSGGGTTNDEEESFVDRVEFVELDQFDQWRSIVVQQQQQQQQSWDALILDIGSMIGNDLHLTALSLANELLKLMALLSTQNKNDESGVVNMPRIVLIKSKSLSSLARRLVHNQRLIDGTQRLPHHLKRSHHPYIIASVGVEQYRRTIPHVVRAGDALLEVGCHYGRTTFRLHSAAAVDKDGFCIGVDIGPKIILRAKKEYPGVPFEICDAWRTLELVQLKSKLLPDTSNVSFGYDAIYADIGGLSGSDGLLESLALLDALGYALEPRCIVIKSLCMTRLASQLRAFSDVWANVNHKTNEELQ